MSSELDLHGKTVEEAIPLVDRFLEDCFCGGMNRVWIVHGKGTGTLRQEVRQHVGRHRFVRSFSTADGSHGGDGAVQVDLGERRGGGKGERR